MNNQQEQEFKDALAELEAALEAPVIPGELDGWAENAARTAQVFDKHFRHRMARLHAPALREIGTEDAELIRRVEQLREADYRLRLDCSAFLAAANKFATSAALAEPDESSASSTQQQIAQDGIDLVIAVRKQELALTTWTIEALDRDRGVQD